MKNSIVKTYRDLVVWQKAYELAKRVYQITKGFPKEELYGISSQIRRAAVSVPSNIAEGYGRRRRLEYERFLSIARGSLFELQTQLCLAKDLSLADKNEFPELLQLCNEVERMLNSLIKRILDGI